ncbi:MipA/OmpV family protein [Klebsiella pneumoniae]
MAAISFSSLAYSSDNTSQITVGLGAQYSPKYEGSDKYNTDLAPFVEWTDGTWFVNSLQGVGLNHEFNNGFYVGQSLGYSLGRTDDNDSWLRQGSDKLKGMGKIKAAMTSNTKLGWWITPKFGIEGNITAPITDSQGMNYSAKVNYLLFNNDYDTITLSAEGVYGDSRFNNTWFGVNKNQSIKSGYKQYKSGSGLTNINYDINWNHTFNERWTGFAAVNYFMLQDKVKESPIVQKNNYVVFTLGALYKF